MQRIRFMIKHFLKQPLWFKILSISSLLISIIFSSSFFSDDSYVQGLSKLAAAIFFCACGYNLRRSRLNSIIMYTAAIICMFLFGAHIASAF